MPSPRPLLMGVVCVLAGVLATGCTSAPLAGTHPSMNLWYTCCATDVGTTAWHPGQRVRLPWTAIYPKLRKATWRPPLILTAVLTGPYGTTSRLKNANKFGPDQSRIVAAAPAIKLASVPTSSPVSFVTIPSGAAPGSYDLSFVVTSGVFSVSWDTIVTVA